MLHNILKRPLLGPVLVCQEEGELICTLYIDVKIDKLYSIPSHIVQSRASNSIQLPEACSFPPAQPPHFCWLQRANVKIYIKTSKPLMFK